MPWAGAKVRRACSRAGQGSRTHELGAARVWGYLHIMSTTPSDSRYIPFTQQPSCCVPTCIQMVMYRQDIPLLAAEEIGHHLGLTVPPERSALFYGDVETEVSDGFPLGGIRSHLPEYHPNAAFARLGIPLHFTVEQSPASHRARSCLRDCARSKRTTATRYCPGTSGCCWRTRVGTGRMSPSLTA